MGRDRPARVTNVVSKCNRDDKVVYKKIDEADDVIRGMIKAGQAEPGDLEPYYCTVHVGYHIGNTFASKLKRLGLVPKKL